MKRNFLFAAVVSAAASFTFLLVCEAGNAQRSAPPAPLPVNPAVESRTQGPSDPLTLWYRTPSKQWTDALAIGTGPESSRCVQGAAGDSQGACGRRLGGGGQAGVAEFDLVDPL